MKGQIYFKFMDWFTEMGSTPGTEVIAAWLGSDIQYAQEGIDDFRQLFNRAYANGVGEDTEGFANANWIAANRTHVFIQSMNWKFDCVLMTQVQARAVLDDYQKFREHGRRDQANPPAPFDVEYEAEGEEAFRLASLMDLDFTPAADEA